MESPKGIFLLFRQATTLPKPRQIQDYKTAMAETLEASRANTRIPYWRMAIDQAGVTLEVLAYEYPGEATEDDPTPYCRFRRHHQQGARVTQSGTKH